MSEEVKGKFAQISMPQAQGVEPQPMVRRVLGSFQAEYTRKDDNVIYHLFRKTESAWPVGFEHVIWEVFVEQFRLRDRKEKLTVEWVPEVFSWCVTVEDVAKFVIPTVEFLEEPLRLLDRRVLGDAA